jgi:hypothetical protein
LGPGVLNRCEDCLGPDDVHELDLGQVDLHRGPACARGRPPGSRRRACRAANRVASTPSRLEVNVACDQHAYAIGRSPTDYRPSGWIVLMPLHGARGKWGGAAIPSLLPFYPPPRRKRGCIAPRCSPCRPALSRPNFETPGRSSLESRAGAALVIPGQRVDRPAAPLESAEGRGRGLRGRRSAPAPFTSAGTATPRS